MSSDDFLSRWSRRKLEVRHEGKTEPAAPVEPDDTPVEEAEPEVTAEEIAALPKIEEMTPETDITLFLRKGVPEMLKKAALRRMWSLDPAIRDYVSEAREYAYDWNMPGGVPGNGPLLPTDDIGKMLARVFGDEPAPSATDPASAPSQGRDRQIPRDRDDAGEPPDAVPQDLPAESNVILTVSDEALQLDGGAGDDRVDETVREQPAEPERLRAVPSRRHGGAIPV